MVAAFFAGFLSGKSEQPYRQDLVFSFRRNRRKIVCLRESVFFGIRVYGTLRGGLFRMVPGIPQTYGAARSKKPVLGVGFWVLEKTGQYSIPGIVPG